jgi:Domain of unknown function (DUF1127)
MGDFLGIRAAAGNFAGRFAAAQRRRRTLRTLESLPPSILKDIGFAVDEAGYDVDMRRRGR